MSSNSKCQKLYGEQNGRHRKDVNGASFRKIFVDRLTNLPRSLKTKILSYLPTKDVVKTSILSTKWKRSWTCVTNLDFDDNLIWSRDNTLSTHDFVNFVNLVMLLHDRSCLQRFHMKCCEYYRESDINSWIATALLCKVKELGLSVRINSTTHLLPSDIFLCRTLVALDLSIRCQVNIPASVCLPVLKNLRLSEVELSTDMSIITLLSGCPELRDLRLRMCIGKDVRIINIISSTLTSLTMENLPGSFGIDWQYHIIIDTPALEYLYIIDDEAVAQSYLMKDLNHLITTAISIGALNEEDEFVWDPDSITDLFAGISQARNLILSHETMQGICSFDLVLPTFHNLKNMKLDTRFNDAANHYVWSRIHKLLGKSPYLETLDLRPGSGYGVYSGDYATDVPTCLLLHLKVIKISGFEGLESEMESTEYFLENGKVLEKLSIEYEHFHVFEPFLRYNGKSESFYYHG